MRSIEEQMKEIKRRKASLQLSRSGMAFYLEYFFKIFSGVGKIAKKCIIYNEEVN